MAKLTADQKIAAKAWIHDVFMAGGLLNPAKCARPQGYKLMYGDQSPAIKQAAKNICAEITGRGFNLNNLDTDLDTLSNYYFNTDLKSNRYWGNTVKRKPANMLARYIADFCYEHGIFWDDTNKTQYEKDAYLTSILGKELALYGCFLSQQNTQKTARTRSVSTGSVSNNGQPISGYKSSGPHSGDIPNLTGAPGNKINLSGIVFCIEADKIGKNTPNAFITPLQVIGNTINTVSKASAEAIKFGSGNGYTDCKLWFADQNLAANALAYCQNKFGTKFTNYCVSRANADKNGYFQVSTALGLAYIKAGRLNEELDEALANKPIPKLGTLDIEAFYKERD